MKLHRILFSLVLALPMLAKAQIGYDVFGATRAAVLTAPQNIVAGNSLITNTIDLVNFDGNVCLFMLSNTNGAAGGTLTANLYSSYDKTNFTAVSTYALATSSTIVSTNRYYGGLLLTTNTWPLPGVWTVPTASTSGWAAPYFVGAQYTNSAAVTLSNPSVVNIGLPANDIGRYLHIVYTVGGSVTNYTVANIVVGHTHSAQLQ